MKERYFDHHSETVRPGSQNPDFFESINFLGLSSQERDYFLEARQQSLYSDEVLLNPTNHSSILRLRHTAIHEIAHVLALTRGGGTFIKATVIAGAGYLGMAVGIPKSREHLMAFAAASEIGERVMGITDHRGGVGDRKSIKQMANFLSAIKYNFRVSPESLIAEAYRSANALLSGVSEKVINHRAVNLVKHGTVFA